MSKKEEPKPNLNADEKKEIKEDVKDAIGKAFSQKTSIDKTLKEGTTHTLNQDEVDKIINKKQNTDRRPIIITIILIVLITLAGLYMYFSNNPTTIFIKAIDKTFNTVEKNIIQSDTKINKNIDVNYKQTFKNQTQNDLRLKINYQSDIKEKILKADIETTYNNEHLLAGQIYSENNKIYLYSEDILNKYIEIGSHSQMTNKQKQIILNSLNKAITKSIENEKIIGSKQQIDVNGKTIKTYRSSLIIDKNNKENILNNINDNLKEDKKFIDTLKQITEKSETDIKNDITNEINQKRQELSKVDKLTINIYTKGAIQEFVKLEIKKVINNEESISSLTNIKKNKYTYLIDDKTMKEKVSGNIEYQNKNNNMKIKIDSKVESKNPHTTILTINIQNEKAKEIDKIDISNSIKGEELTEADSIKITTKILSNPTIGKFVMNWK